MALRDRKKKSKSGPEAGFGLSPDGMILSECYHKFEYRNSNFENKFKIRMPPSPKHKRGGPWFWSFEF